jgi:hypothetical protein
MGLSLTALYEVVVQFGKHLYFQLQLGLQMDTGVRIPKPLLLSAILVDWDYWSMVEVWELWRWLGIHLI